MNYRTITYNQRDKSLKKHIGRDKLVGHKMGSEQFHLQKPSRFLTKKKHGINSKIPICGLNKHLKRYTLFSLERKNGFTSSPCSILITKHGVCFKTHICGIRLGSRVVKFSLVISSWFRSYKSRQGLINLYWTKVPDSIGHWNSN